MSCSFTVLYLLITHLFEGVHIRAESEREKSARVTRIQKNKGLEVIPANRYSSYWRLREIYLQGNVIRYVSPSAFNQTDIRMINLNDNKLQCLPDFTIVRDTLIRLYIANNLLGECENDTCYNVTLPAMKTLYLKRNGLKLLPNIVMASVNLVYLYLGQNKFVQVPDLTTWLPKLTTLDLRDNPLNCAYENLWLGKFGTEQTLFLTKKLTCDLTRPRPSTPSHNCRTNLVMVTHQTTMLSGTILQFLK